MLCWSVNGQRVIPQWQGVPNHLVIGWLKGAPMSLNQTMEFQGRCGKRVSWNLLEEMAHFFLGSHWGWCDDCMQCTPCEPERTNVRMKIIMRWQAEKREGTCISPPTLAK